MPFAKSLKTVLKCLSLLFFFFFSNNYHVGFDLAIPRDGHSEHKLAKLCRGRISSNLQWV